MNRIPAFGSILFIVFILFVLLNDPDAGRRARGE